MPRIFLIDFENVHSDGVSGVEQLTENDEVVIFYSNTADTITFEMMHKLMFCSAKLSYYKVRRGGRNALDFQLASYLGYLVHSRAEEENVEFYLVSKDAGFDFVTDFWESGNTAERPKIKRLFAIKALFMPKPKPLPLRPAPPVKAIGENAVTAAPAPAVTPAAVTVSPAPAVTAAPAPAVTAAPAPAVTAAPAPAVTAAPAPAATPALAPAVTAPQRFPAVAVAAPKPAAPATPARTAPSAAGTPVAKSRPPLDESALIVDIQPATVPYIPNRQPAPLPTAKPVASARTAPAAGGTATGGTPAAKPAVAETPVPAAVIAEENADPTLKPQTKKPVRTARKPYGPRKPKVAPPAETEAAVPAPKPAKTPPQKPSAAKPAKTVAKSESASVHEAADPETSAAVDELLAGAATSQELYRNTVKRFGQKKGMEIYRNIKSRFYTNRNKARISADSDTAE